MGTVRGLLTFVLGVLLTVFVATYLAGEIIETVVITTYDEAGVPHSGKVWVVDHDGAMWVRVANPERAWFQRVVGHPQIEVERDGKTTRVVAVPDTSAEGRARLDAAFREKYGITDWWYGVLLRRDAVPIRLDPAPSAE